MCICNVWYAISLLYELEEQITYYVFLLPLSPYSDCTFSTPDNSGRYCPREFQEAEICGRCFK